MKKTNAEDYAKTIKRLESIKKTGVNLRVVWEHDIQNMLSRNRDMRVFFANCSHLHRLRPRDGFLGGRTQVYCMYREIKEGEIYMRTDYNSLYPWIQYKIAEYPLGSPIVITRDFKAVPKNGPVPYKGLFLVEVLPPKNLPFPILGVKIDSKLFFTLCAPCAKLKNNTACKHSDDERKMLLTTTHVELNLALKNGYKLLDYVHYRFLFEELL